MTAHGLINENSWKLSVFIYYQFKIEFDIFKTDDLRGSKIEIYLSY